MFARCKPPLGKLIGLLVVVLVAAWGYRALGQAPAEQAANPQKRPPLVVVQAAKRQDIDVYLTGLGAVTAEKTVTVKSRVDGELMEVLFREGQSVKQGDLLVRIDPRPFEVQLTQAQGQLTKDLALLNNAQLDLKRYKELSQKGVIARQQYDTQLSLVHQYEGAVASDRSQVDNAKLQLTYSRITAPITGRVGLRLVDPGNMVHATDTTGLLVITQISPINVVFSIAEDNLPVVLARIRTGEPLRVEIYDREQKHLLTTGELSTLDNQINSSTGTVKLKARFANADHALFPNQFVNARLLADVLHQVVTVPAQAVQRGSQGAFVYVLTPDKTVSLRSVETGQTAAGVTVVSKGLQAGERVVVEGADRLRDKAAVTVGEPDQPQAGETDTKLDGQQNAGLDAGAGK